jgi:hypothetical protein
MATATNDGMRNRTMRGSDTPTRSADFSETT